MCFPCIDGTLVEIKSSTECGEQHEADNELVEERHRQTAQLRDEEDFWFWSGHNAKSTFLAGRNWFRFPHFF